MVGYLVLFSWPVAVALFLRFCRPAVAVIAAVIGGYLLLPTQTGIDLPLLPALDKNTLPALSAILLALLLLRTDAREGPGDDGTAGVGRRPGWLVRGALPRLLLAALFAGSFLTVLANRDPITVGNVVLPAVSMFDGFSMILGTLMALLPFVLGYRFLGGAREQLLLLAGLAIAGLGYSLLALYEVRMSPQMNNMVYGFFPHSWAQHVRAGGFRPIVFLEHGLWLAIFFAMAILAAFGLSRAAGPDRRWHWLAAGLWLLMTLILSRSLGALLITLALIPAVLFLSARLQLLLAAALALCVVLYPMLRYQGLISTSRALAVAESIDADRAASLATRFANEEAMLAKAKERALFGWGGWGRSRIQDADGRDISIADGYWIIRFGVSGWVGYLATFGLLVSPILILGFGRHRLLRDGTPGGRIATATLALVLTANLVDLIPNATVTPVTWLIAGALWGRLEANARDPATAGSGAAVEGPSGPLPGSLPGGRRPVYTRQQKRFERRVLR